MNIGYLELNKRSILAPLAGAADRQFRLIVKQEGVELMFSELISSDGLVHGSPGTKELCNILSEERPLGLQIFGSDPYVMEQAASIIEKYKPELIDLNFGCPVKKVVKRGAGSALLKDLDMLYAITKRVVDKVSIPVTAKIRSGWDAGSLVAIEAAKLLEKAGVKAITVHPRTRSDGFSGKADWPVIKKVKETVSVPVIGNGDINSPEDAEEMINSTGCDFVMIGRGALGRPWIFHQIDHYLSTGEKLPEPSDREKLDVCIKHFNLAIKMEDEHRAVKEMRKHIAWYVRGMRNSAKLKGEVFKLNQAEDVVRTLKEFQKEL